MGLLFLNSDTSSFPIPNLLFPFSLIHKSYKLVFNAMQQEKLILS